MSTRAAPASAPKKSESRSAAQPVRERQGKVHASPGHGALQGGAPLPMSLRARMEHSFGRSFEGVRVHTGGSANSMADGHRAEAVTTGTDIAFGSGRYKPDTTPGQHLIAHELAHVAQQGATGGTDIAPQPRSLVSHPSESAEVAAESAASRAVRGESASIGADYSIRGRIMRRALGTPPNPAPLVGRVQPAATVASAPPVQEAAIGRLANATTPAAALDAVKPEPVRATGQGEMMAQEQADEARAAVDEAVEEEAQVAKEEPPPSGVVEQMSGGGAAQQAAPAAVQEAPSVAEADMKDEAAAEAEGAKAGEEAKQAEAAPEEPAATPKSPSSPAEDKAFQSVLRRGRAVARQQAHNNTAKRKAAEAQAAAPGPANEVESLAAGNQVGKMAEQEPAAFDKESFKAALIAKINEIAPGTLEEADKFKANGSAGQLKGAVAGQVAASKAGAEGPVKTTAAEEPATAGVQGKEVLPQPATEAGAPPADIGATSAAPKPKTDAEISLEAGPKSLEEKQAEAGVKDDTLAKSNESDFTGALDAKTEAKEHSETAPVAYREQEAGLLSSAESQAANTAQTETGAMYGTRQEKFSSVQGEQDSTKSDDTAKRDEITAHIHGIFEDTKGQVQDKLTALDGEVNDAFDAGSDNARLEFDNEVEREKEAYKVRRYSGVDGALLWLHDLILPLPDEVKEIYQTARANYLSAMSVVIDDVASIVETGLNGAMELIQTGRNSVLEYVSSLDSELRTIGEDAAAGIQADFDTLATEVENHQQAMIDNLAQKYVDNLKNIDARIEAMEQEDRGLIGAAMDAIQGVIDTIIELKNMLLGILAKAAGVIDKIIEDPIAFLGNLVAGIKAGLSGFVGNIATHLKNGLMGWLFGAVAAAGIQMPESFDLKGLLSLGAQVLGLTWANIRSRAVRIVGEPVVAAMETAVEIFRILMTEGLGGVWTYIQGMLSDLVDTVMGAIRDWVIEKIVIAGITWLLSLLNPASAFIRACKMIYDVVMFFISRGSQIMALVNAVLDSVAAIASGATGAMAAAVEGALASAVPVAISFLASLLGLGGISEAIRGAIEKIQAPVNKAIDWLINKAVSLAKGLVGLLGGKKKKDDKKDEQKETDDPEHDAKVTAGLASIDQEEAKYEEKEEIDEAEANKVATTVKKNHPVFRSITVVPEGKRWTYNYVASNGKHRGALQQPIVEVSVLDVKPPGTSTVGPLQGLTTQRSALTPRVGATDPERAKKLKSKSKDPKKRASTPDVFEHSVGTAVEAATGLPMQAGNQAFLTENISEADRKRGVTGQMPATPQLFDSPIVTDPIEETLPPDATRAPLGASIPDTLLIGGGRIEVFEATLDAHFSIGRGKGVPGSSHKRTQIANTIKNLAARFPGVPIVYNIVTRDALHPQVRTEIERELRSAAGVGSTVEVIWRS